VWCVSGSSSLLLVMLENRVSGVRSENLSQTSFLPAYRSAVEMNQLPAPTKANRQNKGTTGRCGVPRAPVVFIGRTKGEMRKAGSSAHARNKQPQAEAPKKIQPAGVGRVTPAEPVMPVRCCPERPPGWSRVPGALVSGTSL